MSLRSKPIASIDESDLQILVDNQVAEEKFIEYKEVLSGRTDSERKEFLADVSSFANASGGDLIYGIKAISGVPSDVVGLDFQINDADPVILRLDEMMRDGIRPRIPGISVRAISVKTDRTAIVIRIPRSWAMPHQVIFNKHYRFYSRSSNGKYILDVDELRTAFNLSSTTAERIREFRGGRLASIIAKEAPILLDDDPKIVLHLIPFSAFDLVSRFNVSQLSQDTTGNLDPLYHKSSSSSQWSSYERRHNFDGFLTSEKTGSNPCAYLQVFRNGIVEALDSHFLLNAGNGEKRIRVDWLEEGLLLWVKKYLSIQESIGVEPPMFLFISLFGIKGFPFTRYDSMGFRRDFGQMEKNDLILPDVMIESFDSDLTQVMKPIFDMIWNAAGEAGSENYDQDGNRIKP